MPVARVSTLSCSVALVWSASSKATKHEQARSVTLKQLTDYHLFTGLLQRHKSNCQYTAWTIFSLLHQSFLLSLNSVLFSFFSFLELLFLLLWTLKWCTALTIFVPQSRYMLGFAGLLYSLPYSLKYCITTGKPQDYGLSIKRFSD